MKILFCCTHNRCRSRMAEALTRARHPDWVVESAGSAPTGEIDPGARRILQEIGLDVGGPAHDLREMPLETYDWIVTLCADEDVCPVVPANVRHRVRHVPFEDPSKNADDLEESVRWARYRRVRDEIDRFCASLDRLNETASKSESGKPFL